MRRMMAMRHFSETVAKQTALFCILVIINFISGCATTSQQQQLLFVDQQHQAWVQSIAAYQPAITDQNQSLFKISDEMRSLVHKKFSNLPKKKALKKLANWLIDDDQIGMKYEINANFTPIEAFEHRQANCLSFTILLVNLAKSIDIELQYNDVKLPNIWGQDDERNTFTLFRHVNAIRKPPAETLVFDLAIQDYEHGFPQKIISEHKAAAQLQSNLAIKHLKNDDLERAYRHIKYAISLYPNGADFWLNLGVMYKREKQFQNAERALLHAFNLDKNHALAASNLERLYQESNQISKANHFKKLAIKARKKNPYLHYMAAKQHLKHKHYRQAKKAINRAIRLHDQDPRFYELSSIIQQYTDNFSQALKDLQTASNLTMNHEDKVRYLEKAQLIVTQLQNRQAESRGSGEFIRPF